MSDRSSVFKWITLGAAVGLIALPVLSTPALADHVSVGISLTPPADRVEVMGAMPHPGWVFIKGHWRRSDGQWVWVAGRWAGPPHAGAVWIRGHYNRRGEWVEGHWRLRR